MTRRSKRRAVAIFVVDATSGVPLICGALLLVPAFGIGATAASRELLPGLADPLNLCLTACLFLAPAASGVAAAHMVWSVRSGAFAIADTSPSGSWRSWGLAASASLAWALTAYAVLLVIVLATTDLAGPRTLSMSLLALQGAALVTFASIAGSSVGHLATTMWAPPLCAISLFAFLFVLEYSDGPIGRLSPTYAAVFYQVNLVPNGLLVAGVSALLIGACLLVLGVERWRGAGRPTLAVGLVSGVFLMCGGVAVTNAPSGDVDFRSGGESRCMEDGLVTLCVFAESEPKLASMTAALAQAQEAASPLFDAPRHFRQPNSPSPDDRPTAVDIPPNIESGGELGRAVGAIIPGQNCARYSREHNQAMGLIFERLYPGSTGETIMAAVAQQSDRSQKRWLHARLIKLQTC